MFRAVLWPAILEGAEKKGHLNLFPSMCVFLKGSLKASDNTVLVAFY